MPRVEFFRVPHIIIEEFDLKSYENLSNARFILERFKELSKNVTIMNHTYNVY